MFWIISTLLAVLVGLAVAAPLFAGGKGKDAGADKRDVGVYKAQLAEVDRDLERGVLDAEEAERVRVEISRRLLEADARPDAGMRQAGGGIAAAAVLVGATVAAALLAYTWMGRPDLPDLPLQARIDQAQAAMQDRISQAEAEDRAGLPEFFAEAKDEDVALVRKLAGILENRPEDLRGHRLLAQNAAQLGNFRMAHDAQAKVVDLLGPAARAEDFALLAELQILAAGGFVSPEAEEALRRAVQLDPDNGSARFYSGLLFAENDRPDLAFQLWAPLYEESAPDAPWMRAINALLPDIARAAGVRYTLPDKSGPAPATGPGPTADDLAAASDMTSEEQQAMIEGMVERLSDRLATDGGPPEDWARLIRSLAVLGETEKARTVWIEAKSTFATSQAALDIVRPAAVAAGVAD